MSKHKKKFQKKWRAEILEHMGKAPNQPQKQKFAPVQPKSQPTTILSPVSPVSQPEKQPEKTENKPSFNPTQQTIIDNENAVVIKYLSSDLKKVGLVMGGMFLILVAATIISSKTNWLLTLSDKIFKVLHLG